MEIKIHSSVQIDKQFEEYVAAKVAKLRRFIFDEGVAELYLKKEGPEYISEISIHTKHFTIFLKESGNDLNSSVETLFDKVKIKLRKNHDKIIDKSHK